MKAFKNLFVYQLNGKPLGAYLADVPLEAAFVPCGPTQAKSLGFVPPRGEAHGALYEVIDGQAIYKLITEVRAVPGQAVAQRAEQMADEIESAVGRRPGRKHMKELREQALQELMPSVIPRQSATWIWIDRKEKRLIVGTGSAARAEEAVSLMVKTWPGISASLIQTARSPAQAMSTWLLGDEPDTFSIQRQLVLVSQDEMRSSVRYDKHTLNLEEVRAHIVSGKVPTKLALEFGGSVTFVLTDSLQLKQIKFLDIVWKDEGVKPKDVAESFAASVAILTGQLRNLLNHLIHELN